MSKYGSLENYLRDQPWDEVPMSFADIERVIGARLPPAAQRHRAWWSNNASNNVMTKAWLNAGFRSERVDLEGRKLVFRRTAQRRTTHGESAMAEASAKFQPTAARTAKQHPLVGALKGVLVIAPDFDLTQPAMPEWADQLNAKYGHELRK